MDHSRKMSTSVVYQKFWKIIMNCSITLYLDPNFLENIYKYRNSQNGGSQGESKYVKYSVRSILNILPIFKGP